jgi:hypothetical protein
VGKKDRHKGKHHKDQRGKDERRKGKQRDEGESPRRDREKRKRAGKGDAVKLDGERGHHRALAKDVDVSAKGTTKATRSAHKHVDLYDVFESIHYREFKILLKAEDFDAELAAEVKDYWKLARRIAGQLLISVQRGSEEDVPKHRDIVFLDTPDFDLYRNSFMLRVRRPYVGGEPGEAYELTLKYRDPDVGRAAEVDVGPAKGVNGRVKFKEEILLVSSALGGMRSIFSHTCQLPGESGPIHPTFGDYVAMFPGLAKLGLKPRTKVLPATTVPVQEVLYDLGLFGFRGAKTAKVDMAVWRNPTTKAIMIGEFAYETHFNHYGRLNPVPKLRSERLYRLLQRETGAWVELGTTKTAMYYALSGKKVSHDE